MSDPVRLTREGAIATLTLDRPERRNALDRAMWAAIPPLVARAEAEPSVRVLIVTGAGGHFAAGADISEFAEAYRDAAASAATAEAVRAATDALADFAKPAIAAISGVCMGGGVSLALACDLRFAASDARFAVPPARLGIAFPPNDLSRLVTAIGPSRAKDLLFSARVVEAAEALSIGLIDRVAAPQDLAAAVQSYAQALCALSPQAHRMLKHAVANAGGSDGWEEYLKGFAGADFREGYAAFLEKRRPRFG